MNEQHSCPLCTETYDERTNLRVHLEVNHRKSEIVTHLVGGTDTSVGSPVDGEPTAADEERPTSSAD